jgi:hypothetical protein
VPGNLAAVCRYHPVEGLPGDQDRWSEPVEVARPERDRGVDLIAYLDLDEAGGGFVACPIQLKAATSASFSIDAKYRKFSASGMIHAFLWHVQEPDRAVTYALTWEKLLGVANGMGWTATSSWTATAKYTTNRPSERPSSQLRAYLVRPGDWKSKIRNAVRATR